MKCEWCSEERPDDEIVCNFGVCDKCFDASYSEYIEQTAGPFDWIVNA